MLSKDHCRNRFKISAGGVGGGGWGGAGLGGGGEACTQKVRRRSMECPENVHRMPRDFRSPRHGKPSTLIGPRIKISIGCPEKVRRRSMGPREEGGWGQRRGKGVGGLKREGKN